MRGLVKMAASTSQIISVILIVVLAIAAIMGWMRPVEMAPGEVKTVTETQRVTVTQTVVRTETVTQAQQAGGVAQQAAPATALSNLKVAIILPIDEKDLSWNYAAYKAINDLKELYGFQLEVHRQLFDGTKAEPVVRDLAERGFDVIILQGIQYMDMALKVAPNYPDTLFVCVDCFKTGVPNVYNIWMTLEEGAFVLGIAAGLLTKSNKIGIIGGGRVPSIWAGHEAFKAGVLLVNPNVEFFEYYAPFSWADVAGARRAAEQFIERGADIIFSSGDGIDVGTSLAASENKVWFTTVYADASKVLPEDRKETLLGSIVFNWDIVFSKALRDKVMGTWENGFLTATMASGIVKVSFGPNVPRDVVEKALIYQSLILQGLLKIHFDVDPEKLTFKCFDNPDLPECKPTAAKLTFEYRAPLTRQE